jgi:uncharacterized membrane protein
VLEYLQIHFCKEGLIMKQTAVKKLCVCSICIALCYVLPVAFHAVALGSALSPMHIPVLLCGLICGGGYGMVCGLMGPVLSSILSGMPPMTALVFMVPELVVYGLVSGLGTSLIRTGKTVVDLYVAQVAAMLLGRIVGGIAKALFFLGTGEAFGVAAWVSGYFISAAPGIVAHLVLIPPLVLVLMGAGVIPRRYTNVC